MNIDHATQKKERRAEEAEFPGDGEVTQRRQRVAGRCNRSDTPAQPAEPDLADTAG